MLNVQLYLFDYNYFCMFVSFNVGQLIINVLIMNNVISQSELSITNELYSLRKFSLLKVLNSVPSVQRRLLVKTICSQLRISKQTLYNWCNISVRDSQDIPYHSVIYLNNLLGVCIATSN